MQAAGPRGFSPLQMIERCFYIHQLRRADRSINPSAAYLCSASLSYFDTAGFGEVTTSSYNSSIQLR